MVEIMEQCRQKEGPLYCVAKDNTDVEQRLDSHGFHNCLRLAFASFFIDGTAMLFKLYIGCRHLVAKLFGPYVYLDPESTYVLNRL